ncbi:hypothetical protein [Flavisolibacter ginsenosidimutans]|uniref:PorT family protein n=1 Tax=Flavisolibacter ginsenosidimutans TaxID=661481 RepID=A0A5B8UH17_9BACT|nr:hypothetical protein [Flavisolibacter ginsenosidimutans]QEC55788.1 hypothetical protein FSB75_07745 [Flavisolibacter ginsenosidimutans]
MQNSFEKDVQQKMEELRLTPSEPVWERIEVEIKVEKKKRRGIFWFLLAGFLLGGGWWLYQSSSNNANSVSKQAAGEPHGLTAKKKTEQQTPHEKESLIAKQQKNTSLKTGIEIAANTVALYCEKSFITKVQQPFLQKISSAPTQKNNVLLAQLPNVRKEENAPVDLREKQTMRNNDRAQNETRNSLNLQATTQSSSTGKTDSATKGPETNENKSQPKTDTVLKKKIASANKWRKEFSLSTGWSNSTQARSANYFLAASYASSPTQANRLAFVPSQVTKGLFFSTGFSVAKKIGERWEITAGVQYTYASTHQKLGDKKEADTLVRFAGDKLVANGFYTNTGTNNYTARFHFVEIPFSLSFRPSLRLPLYVSVGAAYGRLLSTNALTFSSASNLYYQNKENYLHNAVPVFSSVQVEFFGKRRTSLRTGPFFQYNLLKLQKENTSSTPRMFSAGLKTAVIF